MRVGRFIPAAVLALLPLTSARPAGAAQPGCGAVVVASVTLTADVGPCPDGGFIVVNGNVTVDLNGHRLFGTAGLGDGIGLVASGVTGVRILNGSISDFDNGIRLHGAIGALVSGVQVTRNFAPPGHGGVGIEIAESLRTRIVGSEVTGNGRVAGIIDGGQSSLTSIESTQVLDNAAGVLLDSSSGAAIINSRIAGNRFTGLELGPGTAGATIRGNTIAANGFDPTTILRGDGIRLSEPIPPRFGPPRPTGTHVIEGNTVTRNAANGILVGSQANTIRGNLVVGNGANPSGPAFDLFDLNPDCAGNTWSGNVWGTAPPACAGAS